MKYKYVVFGYQRDYFQIMFQDSIDKVGVEYIDSPIRRNKNILLRLLYSLHNSRILNWRWEFPFKYIWYPLYYNNKQDGPFCFVFLMSWCNVKYDQLFKILKNRYPTSKMVLYLEDVVASKTNYNVSLFSKFDLVISYDKRDAEIYHLGYYPTFMSKLCLEKYGGKSTDVCYWGADKGRGKLVSEIYSRFTRFGLICDFLITKPVKSFVYPKGIKLRKNDKPYEDYLHAMSNSKCILEVIQPRAVGYTLRTWEALLYDKVLITNNMEIYNAPFFNEDNFFIFQDISNLDIEKLKRLISKEERKKNNAELFSPVHFIEYIDSQL